MFSKRLFVALSVVMAVCASLVAAPVAWGTPTGEYSVFAQCPYSNPLVEGCIYSQTESGEFIVGKKTVPVSKTITLQGGIYEDEATETKYFVGATNGETLSPTPQNVPGGLSGLINCTEISGSGFWEGVLRSACEAAFEKGLTGVTATTELAGPASDIVVNPGKVVTEKGIALKMPIKVHLENTLLGSECYIGSNAAPIWLEFTSGTTSPPPPNSPISGNAGEQSFNAEGTILTVKNNVLVDNAFSAPEASGCGGILSFLIDPILNADMGLPSAAGHNTAILKGALESSNAKVVAEH